MTRWRMVVALGFLGLGIGSVAASAQAATAENAAEDEAREREAGQIDQEATTPEGAHMVQQRLMKEFNVGEARIQGLRDHRLGYGEIHHVLSLAEQMPGGITDDNVHHILALRQEQHLGWGAISKQVTGDRLGSIVGRKPTKAAAAPVTMGTRRHAQSPVHPSRSTAPAAKKAGGDGNHVGWPAVHHGGSLGPRLGGERSTTSPGHLR